VVVELIHQCNKPTSLNDKKHLTSQAKHGPYDILKHSWVGLNFQVRQLVTGENLVGKW